MELLDENGNCPVCGRSAAEVRILPYQLMPGTQLQNRYLVGKILGQGGFGITYIGFDLSLDIKVAIKEYFVLNQTSRDNTVSNQLHWTDLKGFSLDVREAFLKEARKMAKISNIPEVARVIDIFNENDTAYIVMEYVEGETLAVRMKKQQRPITWEEVRQVFFPVLRAMELVHQKGVIHRDLSPDNLMLQPDRQVRILDLGAAKDLSSNHGASSMIVAKGGFSPVEQYGERGGSDPRTDIYAICATMYYALTGKVPQTAIDRLEEDTLDFSLLAANGVPADAVSAIRAGLAVRKSDRPSSMSELLALMQGTQSEGISVAINVNCGEEKKSMAFQNKLPISEKNRIPFFLKGMIAATAMLFLVGISAVGFLLNGLLFHEDELGSLPALFVSSGAGNTVLLPQQQEDVETAVPVSSVTLSDAAISLSVGEIYSISAAVEPKNATDPAVIWTSSNERIAAVFEGKISGISAGNAVITATADGISTSCKVTVLEPEIPVRSVNLNLSELTLKVGNHHLLEASVEPIDAADPTVIWSTSDRRVVRVLGGMVTAVAEGTATVTATAGEKSASCTVTVSPAEDAVVTMLPEGIPDTLVFMSGVAGWMTELHLDRDGTFSGIYQDWNLGGVTPEMEKEAGVELPGGQCYRCEFEGRFSNFQKVSDVEYVMEMTELTYLNEPGWYVVDGAWIDNVRSAPGLDGAEKICLYLPGKATADLPDSVISWLVLAHTGELSAELEGWCLYNVTEELPFYGE